MGTLSASTSRTTALLPALGLFLAALAVGLGMRHVPGLAAWQRDQLTTPTLTAVTCTSGWRPSRCCSPWPTCCACPC